MSVLSIFFLVKICFVFSFSFKVFAASQSASSSSFHTREEHLERMFGQHLYHWTSNLGAEKKISQIATTAALKTNKTIGIYFSGSWCNPCQVFTPKLVAYYERLKKESKGFEIVWISLDHTSDDFVTYYQHMPWLAMAADRVAIEGRALSDHFGVEGIPTLVLLDVSHPGFEPKLLTSQAVSKVTADPYGLEFPYESRFAKLKSLVPLNLRRRAYHYKNFGISEIKNTLSMIKSRLNPFVAINRLIQLVKMGALVLKEAIRNGLKGNRSAEL